MSCVVGLVGINSLLSAPCTVLGLAGDHSGSLCVRVQRGRERQRPLPLPAVLQERAH